MPVETGHGLPALPVLAEDGRRVTVDEIRDRRPAVLFFMRAATCPVCLRHARTLAAMRPELDDHGVTPIVVVPGAVADAATVRRRLGDPVRVVSSDEAIAHRAVGLDRSLLLQHSGTLLVDAAGVVRYARTALLPTGGFDRAALREALGRL